MFAQQQLKLFHPQTILKILDVETQEALIIKIAHKTVNNKMLMMPLLLLKFPFVNSNCYCGHLKGEKEEF